VHGPLPEIFASKVEKATIPTMETQAIILFKILRSVFQIFLQLKIEQATVILFYYWI
jgi:hypothetical protein